MSNPVSASRTESKSIPKVLLQAKKEAAVQVLIGKDFGNKSVYEKGPWDKGHWANRK